MRTEKELLKICIDNFDNLNYPGLCCLLYDLKFKKYIKDTEYFLLKELVHKKIKKNNIFNKIFYNTNLISDFSNTNTYFWEPYNKAKRLSFLHYLYHNTKD